MTKTNLYSTCADEVSCGWGLLLAPAAAAVALHVRILALLLLLHCILVGLILVGLAKEHVVVVAAAAIVAEAGLERGIAIALEHG